MISRSVRAPVSLLLDPQLLPSAKPVWVVLRLHAHPGPASQALLQSASGLSRPTVRKALTRLTAAGWVAAAPERPFAALDRAPADARVSMPGALLADRRVGVQGRIVYRVLQVTPGFRQQSGHFTYAQLTGLLGVSRNTVKRAVRELEETGWLETSQRHQWAPLCFTFRNPEIARSEAEVAGAERRINRATYRGEAVMREFLSLIVASNRFQDDAAPGFLVNPFTGERLQLDRFYTQHGVAFEFNGRQHYGPTERFSRAEAARQRGRDYVKLGICVTEGIRLQVIHGEDLTLKTMQAKVGQLLPQRDLSAHGPLIAFLESVGRRYRRAARRGRQLAGVGRPGGAAPRLHHPTCW